MTPGVDPRPFSGRDGATLVLPALPPGDPEGDEVAAFTALVARELPELEAEVGCPVALADAPAPGAPAILLGPARANPVLAAWRSGRPDLPGGPLVTIDRGADRVVVDGDSVAGMGDAMQLMRTAIAERRDLLTPSASGTATEVIDRVDAEVRRTFPRLADRVPGWAEAVDRAGRYAGCG